jgi:GLPGLI family protein
MLCCTFVAKAQKVKPFNGSITYSISYPDSKLDAAVLASQPTETKVIILGNKSKSEVVIQGMVFITQISNGDNKTSITMIDAGGQKIYYKLSEEEIKTQREEDGEAVTELLDETKVIAGITCKKANVKLKDSYGDNFNTTVYYAPEIGSKEINFEGNFKDIPGLPLYYELKQNEQLIVFEAKEIKKGKFKEIDFLIPSDFKELSPEEKQQLLDQFKGQGQ